MKVGGKHKWRYKSEVWKEEKVSPKKWRFTFSQIKSRLGRVAPRGSGFPRGGRLKWGIKAVQRAVKIGPNRYKLVMTGEKTLLGMKRPRDKKWR